MAAGANDVRDDGEDTEAEERAETELTAEVDPHAPEEEDGDGDYCVELVCDGDSILR